MSLGRHTLLNLGGSFIPMVIALATVPLYLGYIGSERYGVLAVIWALLGYFSFFDLGFGYAVTQRMATLSDKDDTNRSNLLWTALLSTFALGLLAGVLLWLSSDYLLLNLIHMSADSHAEVSGAIIWVLLALPVLLPSSVMQGALQARLRFMEVNAIQLTGGVISQLLPLVVAASGHVELKILVPVALVSRVMVLVFLFRQSRLNIPLLGGPMIDCIHLKALLAYGGWISVMTLLAPFLVTIDRLILATLSGAKAVTFYTVPYDLVSRTMVISRSLSSAIFPRLASAGREQSREIAERATIVLVSIMTPIVIVGIFLVQPFLNIWLGAEFARNSAHVGEVILFGVWANALVVPHHARSMASSSPRAVVMIYLFEIPIYLFMLWFGIKYWGVVGAAAAWSVRVVVDTCLLLRLNNAFIPTIRLTAVSMVFVMVAEAVVTQVMLPVYVHWGIAVLLLVLVLIKDRKCLIAAIQTLRLRRANVI